MEFVSKKCKNVKNFDKKLWCQKISSECNIPLSRETFSDERKEKNTHNNNKRIPKLAKIVKNLCKLGEKMKINANGPQKVAASPWLPFFLKMSRCSADTFIPIVCSPYVAFSGSVHEGTNQPVLGLRCFFVKLRNASVIFNVKCELGCLRGKTRIFRGFRPYFRSWNLGFWTFLGFFRCTGRNSKLGLLRNGKIKRLCV